MSRLPTGTVTFLFTDVEGSTALVQRLGEAWSDVIEVHRRLVRNAVAGASGEVVDERGEEFFAAFHRAQDALDAAVELQRAHEAQQWPNGGELRVRTAVHTGEPSVTDTGYLGLDVHRAARMCGAAHGGQILVSRTTADLAGDARLLDLGEYALRGLERPERLFQLVAPGLADRFPAPRTGDDRAASTGRERELAAAALRLVRHARLPALRAPERRPGIAELGWQVRSLLAAAPEGSRHGLAELGGALLAAGSVAADTDRYLATVERRVLTQRLSEYREMAVLSRRAGQEVGAMLERLAALDTLVQARAALETIADEIANALSSHAELAGRRDRVGTATTALEAALGRAREHIGNSGARLRRTPWRGVHRLGNRYVVQWFDEVGVERLAGFEAAADARAYRRALRVKEKAQSDFTGPPLPPTAGASGGVGA